MLTWGITVIHTPGARPAAVKPEVGPTSGRGFRCEGPRCVTTSGQLVWTLACLGRRWVGAGMADAVAGEVLPERDRSRAAPRLHTLKTAGYDDVEDYAQMGADELEAMRGALVGAGVPLGHVGRIMRAVAAKAKMQLRRAERRALRRRR